MLIDFLLTAGGVAFEVISFVLSSIVSLALFFLFDPVLCVFFLLGVLLVGFLAYRKFTSWGTTTADSDSSSSSSSPVKTQKPPTASNAASAAAGGYENDYASSETSSQFSRASSPDIDMEQVKHYEARFSSRFQNFQKIVGDHVSEEDQMELYCSIADFQDGKNHWTEFQTAAASAKLPSEARSDVYASLKDENYIAQPKSVSMARANSEAASNTSTVGRARFPAFSKCCGGFGLSKKGMVSLYWSLADINAAKSAWSAFCHVAAAVKLEKSMRSALYNDLKEEGFVKQPIPK